MNEDELREEEIIQEAEIEIPSFLRPDIKVRAALERGLRSGFLGGISGTRGGMFSLLNPFEARTVEIGYFSREMESPREAESHRPVVDKHCTIIPPGLCGKD